jgi:phosphopentomutase
VEIRDIDALREERAISADLTGRTWQTILDLDVPQRTPEEAGTILTRTARQHACTLFEYFLTDKVGHRRVEQSPAELLSDLNRFLGGLLDALAPRRDTLLITSDHGNLEDRSHTQHTRNPVPLVVYGWAAPHFSTARTIQDVTPGIRQALRSTSDTGSPE